MMPYRRAHRFLRHAVVYTVLPAAIIGLMSLPLPAAEAALARPAETVILTVSGKISRTNAPGKAEFDRAMLTALGLHRFSTSTPWTDGTVLFEGVLIRNLMTALGATGSTMKAIALNDYVSVLPMTDIDRYDAILALTMNGETMSRRDKGPIWIMYPLDAIPEIYELGKTSHLVWQLSHIVVQ